MDKAHAKLRSLAGRALTPSESASRDYVLAVFYRREGKHEQAIPLLRNVIFKGTSDKVNGALYSLADSLAITGHPDEAQECFEQWIRQMGPSADRQAAINLASTIEEARKEEK